MLWTSFFSFFILWLVGFFGLRIQLWYIHVLLAVALLSLLIQLTLKRRQGHGQQRL